MVDDGGADQQPEESQILNALIPKVMEITKCPHTQRKHYAKVRIIMFKISLEHVFKLL
jgi:hypothetical protein